MKERFDFKYTTDEMGRTVHKYRWSVLLMIIMFQYIFYDGAILEMYRQSVPLFNSGHYTLYLIPIILFILLVIFIVGLNYMFNWFEMKSEINFFKKLGFFSKLILDSLLISYFYYIFSYLFIILIMWIIDYYILGTKLQFHPVLTFFIMYLIPFGISTYILVKAMKKTCWLWGLIFGIVLYGLSVSIPNLQIFQGIVFEINILNIIIYMGIGTGFSALWQVIFEKQQHVTGYDFETTPGNQEGS